MASIKEEQKMLLGVRIIDETSLEEDIRCKKCRCYLNVPPITFHKGIGNVCGRCIIDKSGIYLYRPQTRQRAFEVLIKNFILPCNNKNYGCDTILKMDEVVDHEKACGFKYLKCPLFHANCCSWIGSLNLLNIHLKIHQDMIVNNPCQFEYEKGKYYFSLTVVGNQFCIVNMEHHENECKFCVIMCGIESQGFEYELELSNEDKRHSFTIRKGHLEAMENDWMQTLGWSGKILKIDIDKIAEMLKNPKKIRVKVTIRKKNIIELMQIRGLPEGEMQASGSRDSTSIMQVSNENTPDDEILAELECPVCNEFMIPPIYICPTGHSVCSECKSKMPNCSLCRKTFEDCRNFTLEKLTQKVKYPCNNRVIGCNVVTTSDKLKEHQKGCEFQNPCILKCGWKGLPAVLYNHFLESHRDHIIENNTFVAKDTSVENQWQHFLFVMGEIFYFTYKHGGSSTAKFAKFDLKHVGHLEAQPKFKYSITFSPLPAAQPTNLILTHVCKKSRSNLEDAVFIQTVFIPGELFQNRVYYIKVYITRI